MWTYTGPSTGLKDQVRFAVGDTNASDPVLQDEEINYLLRNAGMDVSQAAIYACDAIISKIARLCDETVGSVSIALSQKRQGYVDRLNSLKVAQVLAGNIEPYAGGISRSDKALNYGNLDWQPPDFRHDMLSSQFVRPLLDRPANVPWELYQW